jgi:hypothetical protein
MILQALSEKKQDPFDNDDQPNINQHGREDILYLFVRCMAWLCMIPERIFKEIT